MKLKIILTGLLVISACLYGFRESLLYRIGAFLVVVQPTDNVDVAVTSSLGDKVIQCYLGGHCRKVMIVTAHYGLTWKGNRHPNDENEVKAQAQRSGIKLADLIVFERPQDDIKFFTSMEKLFSDNDLHSAMFYVGFYRSRRYRFYLDRYFHNKNIATYVQPINTDKEYMQNFDRWWENTLLDNLFIDEYLKMAFYYLNKMLWSPVV